MELSDIRITEQNHNKYDISISASNSNNINELLDMQLDIERYICKKLEITSSISYAYFLENLGIESETTNGWWSLCATNHDNISYFIDTELIPQDMKDYKKALNNYEKVKSKVFHRFTTVSDFVNHFK